MSYYPLCNVTDGVSYIDPVLGRSGSFEVVLSFTAQYMKPECGIEMVYGVRDSFCEKAARFFWKNVTGCSFVSDLQEGYLVVN